MKVLHITDSGLPDARIERTPWTSIKFGCKVYFCGPLTYGDNNRNAEQFDPFSGIYNFEWTRFARIKVPGAWMRLKKQFNKILEEIRPDIIHTHNVCAAKLASESRCPFVLDDHEYVSMNIVP